MELINCDFCGKSPTKFRETVGHGATEEALECCGLRVISYAEDVSSTEKWNAIQTLLKLGYIYSLERGNK